MLSKIYYFPHNVLWEVIHLCITEITYKQCSSGKKTPRRFLNSQILIWRKVVQQWIWHNGPTIRCLSYCLCCILLLAIREIKYKQIKNRLRKTILWSAAHLSSHLLNLGDAWLQCHPVLLLCSSTLITKQARFFIKLFSSHTSLVLCCIVLCGDFLHSRNWMFSRIVCT